MPGAARCKLHLRVHVDPWVLLVSQLVRYRYLGVALARLCSVMASPVIASAASHGELLPVPWAAPALSRPRLIQRTLIVYICA